MLNLKNSQFYHAGRFLAPTLLPCDCWHETGLNSTGVIIPGENVAVDAGDWR